MLYIASLDNDLYGIEKPGAKRARASYPGDQNAVIGTPARESQNSWAQAGKQDAHGTRQCSTATMNQRVPRNPPATAMQGERKITVPACRFSQDRPPGMPLFERPRVPPLVKARDSLTLEIHFQRLLCHPINYAERLSSPRLNGR